MARVDFYILSQPGPLPRQTFACRLAEKAYRLENTVHIHVAGQPDAERIDELLWTFRDGSFVPHDIVADAAMTTPAPVTIGYGDSTVEGRDLLINLCDDIPPIAKTFPRVAELVTSDDESKQASRRRYTDYRDHGHALETHRV